MVCVVKQLQLLVLPVCCQRILCQIIRSDTEEIDFTCKLVTDHDCRRGFDHNALRYIAESNLLRSQLLLYLLHDLLHPANLPD